MENSRRKARKVGKKKSGYSTDRLSNLPEAVIHHILSFLDINSAVQTAVLSRRWRSTWKHISVLDFSDSYYSYSYRVLPRFERLFVRELNNKFRVLLRVHWFRANNSMDRLSNLPEAVIHHILSFLDTKSAVQTSVLSRQWKCTWKHVSVLDMRNNLKMLEYSPPGFKRYVEKVLSLRYDSSLTKLIFSDNLEKLDREPENSLLARVIRYALSHETRHLAIRLPLRGGPPWYPLADLLGFNSESCYSLKSLELTTFNFRNRFRWSSFVTLEKLDLVCCTFSAGREEVIIDPFSSLPCLKHLFLNCFFKIGNDDTTLRISGIRLLSLRLSLGYFRKMAIYAPNVEYFAITYASHLVKFTELTLPCVDRAYIRVDYGYKDEYTEEDLFPLLQGLNNATSLELCHRTIRMLRDMSDYLDDQPSPFTRLKSLIVRFVNEVPFAVLNYLLKGSSDVKTGVRFVS
ncbi:Putative F-box/FBD/LRR-repeat protein At4g03220 [Linum grandiflorum]